MKMLMFVCRRCKVELQEDSLIPIHLGSGGQTIYLGKVTGDVLCDYCQELEFRELDKAYNDALEESMRD